MTWRSYPAPGTHRKDHKRKAAPFTDARTQAVADALDPTDAERISEEAKEKAAEVLADFDRKRGRR